MLRASILLKQNYNLSIKLCRAYLTKEYKNVMQQNLPLENISRDDIDAIHVNKRTSAVRTDFMARQLTASEEARTDIVDELVKLRNQADATDIIGSTSHAVIRHFVEVGAANELLELLKNRLQYGVFVDKFSGCYLMDYFIENKRPLEALQVAVEHFLQDDYDNKLVCALALRAGYVALKENSINSIEVPKVEEVKEEKKVRVKFLRNPDPTDRSNDLKYMIGKTLLKMSENASADIKHNFKIPAFILCEQFDDCLAALNATETYDKEILTGSLELLKSNTAAPAELNAAVEAQLNKSQAELLDKPLVEHLNAAIKTEEPNLISKQTENYKLWTQQLNDSLQAAKAHRDKLMRLENVELIMEEIRTKKKQLWYFDMEDSIDMEIYRKFQFYPKKWFGKKKKPRAVDDDYVPPQLR